MSIKSNEQMVSRLEAQSQSLKRYYTGKACKNGHTKERYLSSGQCVECERTRTDVEARRKYMREYNRQRTGLPQPDYPVTNFCEICAVSDNKDVSLCLDHDHETGKFRGWLCSKCNLGIAFLGDNAEGLEKALEYLKR